MEGPKLIIQDSFNSCSKRYCVWVEVTDLDVAKHGGTGPDALFDYIRSKLHKAIDAALNDRLNELDNGN